MFPLYPNISKTAKFDFITGKLLCGPVILKVDSGPGRIIASMESILKRVKFLELGLFILMGLPNATSVNQEMDALYGAFKPATYARGKIILTERLRMRGLQNSAMAAGNREGEGDNEEVHATPNGNDPPAGVRLGARRSAALPSVTMGFEDLATTVDGNKTDYISMNPFTRHFTTDKILQSWLKVGFIPFTRNCVKSKKVRHELGQQQRGSALEDLQMTYEGLVNSAEEHGLNAGILMAGSQWQNPRNEG